MQIKMVDLSRQYQSLPIFPEMKDMEIEMVTTAVREFFRNA